MSRKFRTYVLPLLLATLLITATAALAVPVVQGAGQREALLHLVTTSWGSGGFPGQYNLTGNWYFVEVYHERGRPYNDTLYAGAFYPNQTGYLNITWPADWDNLTVVVKAKTYEGTELGKGELYQGIIVYALYVGENLDVPISDNSTGIDILEISPREFANMYNSTTNKAYTAKAAIMFKTFHVHTWYDEKDNLSYAQIKIYDINHTAADSTDSLLRAVVTNKYGDSLYDPAKTGELYTAGDTNPFEDNTYVPIPLQVMNLTGKHPIAAIRGKSPNLNATVRVWWETVLVNTTLYVPDVDNKGLPGPFTMDDNGTVNNLNSTVFYLACGARDKDVKVNGTLYPGYEGDEIGSALYEASCKINLRDQNGRPYHFMHEWGKTSERYYYRANGTYYAITTNPHEWPGYLDDYRNYMRVPNATMWPQLYDKFQGVVITDGEGNSYNATDEVYVSKYYKGTDDLAQDDPTLIALNDYLKTMTVSDDPGPYRGFRLEIEYAGGFRNSYGGHEEQVATILVSNPYTYAGKLSGWVSASAGPVEGAYVDTVTDDFSDGGLILVPVKVRDIVFIIKDSEGNLLSPDFTEAYLLRENGQPVKLAFFEYDEDVSTSSIAVYEYHGVVTWPFLYRVRIDANFLPSPAPKYIAVAYQVPEELMYGLVVKYQGVTVYQNESAVPKLVESTVVEAKATIYRLKVLFVDCQDRPLVNTPFWMYDPELETEVKFITGPDGGIDFVLPPQTLKFTKLYWKGVDVKFVKAAFPNETSIEAAEDGSITIELTETIRSPIKITALIDDIVFKTYDYAGTTAIPRLNITVSWIGYNISDPTKSNWYFLETMDPSGPTVEANDELPVLLDLPDDFSNDDQFNTSVTVAQFFSYAIYYEADSNEYIFYQMPSTVYNITVTTVTSGDYPTPGLKYWPGTGKNVPYESVIEWAPSDESVAPEEVHGKGITSRVVLRLFNEPIEYTACGTVEFQLNTWALIWNLEMVNGGKLIGDADFTIVNDNGKSVKDVTGYYNTSSWTDPLHFATLIYEDEDWIDYSFIWWNGSYKLDDLTLETNLSFTVDMFYNESAEPNKVWPVLNFTLQPSEELFSKTAIYGNWTEIQEDFEVTEPALHNKVIIYQGETLIAPLPVTFVKPKAVDKGGHPLVNATIELWILDLDVNESNAVKISSADTGSDTLYIDDDGSQLTPLQVTWAWEKKLVESDEPQVFKEIRWDRVTLNFSCGQSYDVRTVQVPPKPAKLLLRDICEERYDVAVTADYIYPVVAKHASLPTDYVSWKTNENGLIDSFTLEGYKGLLMLPTSGYLNETYGYEANHNEIGLIEEFHYRFNVVWKSAVVYSDNFVLTKAPVEFGASEVYSGQFMFTLSNSSSAEQAVGGLNLTIYYYNATDYDYESANGSRIYIISGVDSDGVVPFELLPGPRFMNTTYKYVFAANHTEIDWLDNLVATQFVLNNETFGDGALKTVTTSEITVPIMLNAARWVMFEVLTWRDEAGILTAYPITDYTVKYMIRNKDAGIIAAEGEAKTDAEGKVLVESGTTPTKVFWVGMTIRYRVEPPAYTADYKDSFWKTWLEGKDVELQDKSDKFVAPATAPVMTHAYYPDESPSAWALANITSVLTSIGGNKYACSGLCVLNARSKPFMILVNYTAVTVSVKDFNGRPLAGAFVELIDKATGRIAAWHYTAGKSWTAKPVDIVTLGKTHGLVVEGGVASVKVPLKDEERTFGGVGVTGVMNVSVGPVAFDTDGDDVIDTVNLERGVTRYVTYIVRVYWLPSTDGTGKAIWPYLPDIAQEVYDSERDQVEWKVLLPRALPTGTLAISTSEAPTGALVKEHADVRAAVFDALVRFTYEGKSASAIKEALTAVFSGGFFDKLGEAATFAGTDVVKVVKLPRGTYKLEITYKPKTTSVTFPAYTLDLSNVNIGTVTAEVELPLTDVSFKAVDLQGRSLPGVKVEVTPDLYYELKPPVGGVVTLTAVYKPQIYDVKLTWTSPAYGTTATTSVSDTPAGLNGKAVALPVGIVTVSVVDLEGKPIGGVPVKLGKITKETDAEGKVMFEQVPLESEGAPIKYTFVFTIKGKEFSKDYELSTARTSITFIGELFTLKVRVVGAAGQPLPYAKVKVMRGGVEVGTFTADESGVVQVPDLLLDDYSVEASWKGYTGTGAVTKDDLKTGRIVEISLAPYVEIAGIPLEFGTFVALIIGIILLVIVIVIILSEYIRWRGRRLGIYPPAPPKK